MANCLVTKLKALVDMDNPEYINRIIINVSPESQVEYSTHVNGTNTPLYIQYLDNTSETINPGESGDVKAVGGTITIKTDEIPASGLVLNIGNSSLQCNLNQLGCVKVADLTFAGSVINSKITGEVEKILFSNLSDNGDYSVRWTNIIGDLTVAARNIVQNGEDTGKTVCFRGNGIWIISTSNEPVVSVNGTKYYLTITAYGFVIREGSTSGEIIYQE